MSFRFSGWAIVSIFSIICSSCNGWVGQRAIQEGRRDFNNVIQNTAEQQLFLNLVRVHDNHTPFFMDVSEVDDSVSLSGNLTGGPSGLGAPAVLIVGGKNVGAGSGVSSTVTGTATYSDSPTVRYIPLTGSALVSQMATPITVDSVQQLVDSGWPVRPVLELIAQRLTLSGTESDRQDLLDNIDRLYQRHYLTLAAVKWPPPGSLLPTSPAETFTVSYVPTPAPGGASGPSIQWSTALARSTDHNIYVPLPTEKNGVVTFQPIQPRPSGDLVSRGFWNQMLFAAAGGHGGGGGASAAAGGAAPGGGGGGSPGGGAGPQGSAQGNSGDDTLVLYCNLDDKATAEDRQAWFNILQEYKLPSGYFFKGVLPQSANDPALTLIHFLRLPTIPTTAELNGAVDVNTFTALNPAPLHMRTAMGVLLSSTTSSSWAIYVYGDDVRKVEQAEPTGDGWLADCIYIERGGIKDTHSPSMERISLTETSQAPKGIRLTPLSHTSTRALMVINVSTRVPFDAYISDRGQDGLFYYIRSDDTVSQKNFMLLSLLLTIQSGPPTVPPLTPTFSVGLGH